MYEWCGAQLVQVQENYRGMSLVWTEFVQSQATLLAIGPYRFFPLRKG
jgi:hypothetical protein